MLLLTNSNTMELNGYKIPFNSVLIIQENKKFFILTEIENMFYHINSFFETNNLFVILDRLTWDNNNYTSVTPCNFIFLYTN